MVVLIESPFKARRLKEILRLCDIDAEIVASNGRLFDLPEQRLGITEDLNVSGFVPVDLEHFRSIQLNLEFPGEFYVASDPDEEGDLIAWTVARYRSGLPTKRLRVSDLTVESLRHGFSEATDVDASDPPALARRVFDRLLGYSGRDGMFLSRTAGVILKAAADNAIPTMHTLLSRAGGDDGVLFQEVYGNGANEGDPVNGLVSQPGALPDYRHCLNVAALTGLKPQEAFDALQELYVEGDISYFRTTSGDVNSSALAAMNTIESDLGFENRASVTATATSEAHPGIYSVTGDLSRFNNRRLSLAARHFGQMILNATVCAMAGKECQSERRQRHADGVWQAQQILTRGQVYSYPNSTFTLHTDVLGGAAADWPGRVERPISKESALALVLMASDVGHPSSWASLSHNYACLVDRNGRLSRRGSEFYHKHQREAPLLLDPAIARQVERDLLSPSEPTADKVNRALARVGLDVVGLDLALEPAQDRNVRFPQ